MLQAVLSLNTQTGFLYPQKKHQIDRVSEQDEMLRANFRELTCELCYPGTSVIVKLFQF